MNYDEVNSLLRSVDTTISSATYDHFAHRAPELIEFDLARIDSYDDLRDWLKVYLQQQAIDYGVLGKFLPLFWDWIHELRAYTGILNTKTRWQRLVIHWKTHWKFYTLLCFGLLSIVITALVTKLVT